MASPQLAIAKATLTATLFSADPSSVARPSVEAFFDQLSSTIAQCSRANVQKCKAWIVEHIVPSGTRTAALGKYLIALSKGLVDDDKKPSGKRKRLHVLYLLSDVLHHVAVRTKDDKFATLAEAFLPALVASAAAFENAPKHIKKLRSLIQLWEDKSYFPNTLIGQLQQAIENGHSVVVTAGPAPSNVNLKVAKDAPYTIPSSHGDPSTPWYDLPAASWLPHLTPNSTKPMLPELIQPIQLVAGPAEKPLIAAVEAILLDADRLFAKGSTYDDDTRVDFNELGERVVFDDVTGGIVSGETYYGWSRTFCEKMKERKKKLKTGGNSISRSRSRPISMSRSRSRSSSAPGFKRRRMSSESRSRSRSRQRPRFEDGSPRHAKSPPRRRGREADRSRSYDRGSRSRSGSPERRNQFSRGPPTRFTSQPYQHPPPPPPPQTAQGQQYHQQFPPNNFIPVPPTGDMPFPPPPPPAAGYTGQWLPPPPPPPMAGGHQAWTPDPSMFPQMGNTWNGGWSGNTAPPPPPPPPQNGHFGRGNQGFRGRGRGAYNNRGRGW